MAKAKSTSTKKVAKKSIADAAKETYLKSHTKEQMYAEYNKLNRENTDINIQLKYQKHLTERNKLNSDCFRTNLNDANLQIAKLKLDLKDAKQYGKLFGMLSAAMFLAFVLAVLIN